ncbi:MAG: TniQ family protein [Nitrospirae bacterium]|nr:TniQ family protein [Nitrospirota bacterium]
MILGHSYLSSLNPEGLGTPLAESVTSYIPRLCKLHSISFSTFLSDILFPKMGTLSLVNSIKRGCSRVYTRPYAFNGVSNFTEKIIHTLELLTLQKNLIYITLLPLRNIISCQNVFRHYRAWCPICLAERKDRALTIYEPLVWTIKAVRSCLVHHISLRTQCHKCGNMLPVIARHVQNGFCSTCGHWLGLTDTNNKYPVDPIPDFDSWKDRNIGELISILPETINITRNETLRTVLTEHINLHYKGSASAYARSAKIPKATISRWQAGTALPSLENLLKISYRSQTPLADLITKGRLQKDAKVFDYQDSESLFPASPRKTNDFDYAYVKRHLESVLKSKSENPLSMTKVAENLGYTKKTLYKHFYVLCRHISAKAACHRKARKEQRLGQERLFVEKVAEQLHIEGVYPSYDAIENAAPKKGIMRSHESRDAWKNKLREFGFENGG